MENLLVAATPRGVCAVKLGDDANSLIKELKSEFENASISCEEELIKHFVDLVLDVMKGSKKASELPLDIKATAFQMRVWEELRKIPFGDTITYSELAKRIGNEKSVRAVASACARNSVAIVIPCHRVIGSGGDLRGYRWGIERKRELLRKENPELFPEQGLFG